MTCPRPHPTSWPTSPAHLPPPPDLAAQNTEHLCFLFPFPRTFFSKTMGSLPHFKGHLLSETFLDHLLNSIPVTFTPTPHFISVLPTSPHLSLYHIALCYCQSSTLEYKSWEEEKDFVHHHIPSIQNNFSHIIGSQ